MQGSTGNAQIPAGTKSARLTLALENQTLESINRTVASIINKSGCRMCGRLLNLEFQFQVDPGPDLTGVVSIETEGF
jgi:hypothetical protein